MRGKSFLVSIGVGLYNSRESEQPRAAMLRRARGGYLTKTIELRSTDSRGRLSPHEHLFSSKRS